MRAVRESGEVAPGGGESDRPTLGPSACLSPNGPASSVDATGDFLRPELLTSPVAAPAELLRGIRYAMVVVAPFWLAVVGLFLLWKVR